MNVRSLLGAIGLAAITATAAVPVAAQPVPYNNQYNYREQSLINVGRMATACGKLIGRLQQDARDYGGHREAAIDNLRQAQNELAAAAQFAEAHGYQMPVPQPRGMHVRNPNRIRNPQARSDWSIEKAAMTTQRWIGRLQRDSRDFGGHRMAAIDALGRAHNELAAAAQFAGTRGY